MKDLGISVKGLGQKGDTSSDSPRDIQSLFYGATMGDPNADLFQVTRNQKHSRIILKRRAKIFF